MRKRTLARECALKILYQIDITKTKKSHKDSCDNFWAHCEDEIEPSVREFAQSLVDGTVANSEKIDGMISKYADNWQIGRMALVDRNILRMATFELLFAKETPPKVIINEAVEIAKKYGDVDSGKFVNGILDKINKTETR